MGKEFLAAIWCATCTKMKPVQSHVAGMVQVTTGATGGTPATSEGGGSSTAVVRILLQCTN